MITIDSKLAAELHAFAAARGVSFTDSQAATIVALRLRYDAQRELERTVAIVSTRPAEPTVGRGTITTIGIGELLEPGGPYLLLRRGDEAWLVPDVPNGWDMREPWLGGLNSVRWIGGPPAFAAFRRVGAPV